MSLIVYSKMFDEIEKSLVPYGVSIHDYKNAQEAAGFTYTTNTGECLPTPFFFESNPFRSEMLSSKNVLEIGCGVGRNLSMIMEHTDAHYWGVDPNLKMTQYFWEVQDPKWKSRVTIVSDFKELPTDLSIDTVIVTFVFQHIGFRPPYGQMHVVDITKAAMQYTHNDTVWFVYEHEREERWQERWLSELNIVPEYYFKAGGNHDGGGTLPSIEFATMAHRGNDNNLIMFKEHK